MTSDNEISDLPRHSVCTRDCELSDTFIHGGINITIWNSKSYWNVDIELWDDKAWFGRDGLGDGGVDGINVCCNGASVGRNVSHDWGENHAVILQNKTPIATIKKMINGKARRKLCERRASPLAMRSVFIFRLRDKFGQLLHSSRYNSFCSSLAKQNGILPFFVNGILVNRSIF